MAGGRNSGRTINIQERRRKAVEARKSGASYRRIAEVLAKEYGTRYSRQSAYNDVDACLKELTQELTHETEELRQLELERLDDLQMPLTPKAKAGDVQAIKTIVQIIQQRCKLLGLEAPVTVKIEEGVEFELRGFLDTLSQTLDSETFTKVLKAFEIAQSRAGASEGN
jgi:LPS O-antigen subunit length determinant protein (WzzB/FepE family)